MTATIQKGRSHRVVAIQAMLTYRGTDASTIGILPTVNGIGVEPFARAVFDCSGRASCMVSGSWWLDLDAAEAANPGKFINQPLTIRLLAGELASMTDSGPWDASLSVQLQRK